MLASTVVEYSKPLPVLLLKEDRVATAGFGYAVRFITDRDPGELYIAVYYTLLKTSNLCIAYFDSLNNKIRKSKRCVDYGRDIKARRRLYFHERRRPYDVYLHIRANDYIGIAGDWHNQDFTSYVYILL
ncbi:MAG: hypothetical protein ACK4SY_07800 [Pyrobaculum sp.]